MAGSCSWVEYQRTRQPVRPSGGGGCLIIGVVSACLLGAWVLLTVGGLVHCRVLEQQAPSPWSLPLVGGGVVVGCVFCGLLQVAAHGLCVVRGAAGVV